LVAHGQGDFHPLSSALAFLLGETQ
jgi:hypothetical protein